MYTQFIGINRYIYSIIYIYTCINALYPIHNYTGICIYATTHLQNRCNQCKISKAQSSPKIQDLRGTVLAVVM